MTNSEINVLKNDESSIRFQMLELLSCGVLAYTLPDRRILMVNKEAKRLFDFHGDDDSRFYEIMSAHIPTDDYKEIREAAANLKNVGDNHKYRLHSLRDSGELVTLDCTTKLIELEDKTRVILSVMQDVTARESAVSLLRRERGQYRNALLFGSLYSFNFDVTDGIIHNDFSYCAKGFSIAAALGIEFPIKFDDLEIKWLEVIKPEILTPENFRPETCAHFVKLWESGKTSSTIEYYYPAKDIYIRRTILLSQDDESDHIFAVFYANDITGTVREETRKRTEAEFMNRRLSRQIEITKSFSSVYFGSWEINLETCTVSEITVPEWSHIVIERSDGDYKKAVDVMLDELVNDEFKNAVGEFMRFDTMAARLKERGILTIEYIGTHGGWREGALIPVLRDKNKEVITVIYAIRAIGDAKKIELESKLALEEAYESARRSNAAKTEFLLGMSHDIRTPLNAITGLTAIASAHIDDKERVADCLSKITVSGKHLLGLINEVLDMSKIESGKMSLNPEEFSLPELIDDIVVISRPLITGKNHSFSVSVESIEHENVIGDKQRIQQVFMNLISNAVKYTPDGGTIKLTINEKPTNHKKIGCFEFVIEDNGIGMSKDYLPKLFAPFSRSDDSRVKDIQGTGLGMSITKNIVRMMNGDIKAESELDKGTKFTVIIYLALQNESRRIEKLVGRRVLVASDNAEKRAILCGIVKEHGMEAPQALTSAEAVETAKARKGREDELFAAIIDWNISGRQGAETVRGLREASDKIKLIVSCSEGTKIESEARAAGADLFITDPPVRSQIEYLFRSLAGEEKKLGSSPLDEIQKTNYQNKRVLLAEDNKLNSEIAEEIFNMAKLITDFASDGKEALEIMKNSPEGYYDIIFMDIQMPNMNGYEAARAIRALPGDYAKNIPIIAMTANAFAEDVLMAKDAGMNEHIAKPIDFDKLLLVLKKWLG